MSKIEEHLDSMRDRWDTFNKQDEFAFISFLQEGERWDAIEFHVAGIRFVDYMMERFNQYGKTIPNQSSILEIGCGVGRFLKPLSCRFKYAYGVDISDKMIESAKKYCACMPNVFLKVNNGCSLDMFENESLDYCVSAGVFQHITLFDVILSYISEALRVLKPDGIFLFQFSADRKNAVGQGTRGARITADLLHEGLKGMPCRLLELTRDEYDPIPNLVVVMQKSSIPYPGDPRGENFKTIKIKERAWCKGVYDDAKTKTRFHQNKEEPPVQMTFYDKDTE